MANEKEKGERNLAVWDLYHEGKAEMRDYEELMEEHPLKFSQGTSLYRKAKEGELRCDQCVHFFQRHLDGYTLCEIVRPVPEKAIAPEWTCQFATGDGKNFPLYEGKVLK